MPNFLHLNQPGDKTLIVSGVKFLQIIKYSEIKYLEADNNYTSIFYRDGSSHFICRTLKKFEVELDYGIFFRCHKSYIINIDFIMEVNNMNGLHLILFDGQRIPVARRRWPSLIRIFKNDLVKINKIL